MSQPKHTLNEDSPETTRVCIQFDECKPHWAKQHGYHLIAAECGLTDITVTGDFDSKLTYIYGNVDSFEIFKAKIEQTSLKEGSLYKVETEK